MVILWGFKKTFKAVSLIFLFLSLLLIAACSNNPYNSASSLKQESQKQADTTKESKIEVPEPVASNTEKEADAQAQSNKASTEVQQSQKVNGEVEGKKQEAKPNLPAIAYVFTSNADCCESTKKYYNDHKNIVLELEKKYGKQVKFVWYDVASQDIAMQKVMRQKAAEFSINKVPAFIVLDTGGKVLFSQMGALEAAEVNKIFGGLQG